MAQHKLNSDDILHLMIEKANENGYSLIINGTKDDTLQIAVYPFQGTLVSQEDIAQQLYDIMEQNSVTENHQSYSKFMHDVEPDNLEEWVFSATGPDDTKMETRISVFHNKNVLLKHIRMKI